jgi:hypothetical protein
MAKISTRLSDAASSVNYRNPLQDASGVVEFWWNLIQTLLSAGWVHFASGTGTGGTFSTTPGNANMQLTSTGQGAGGFDRNYAWVVLRCPANKRQILIQRGTAATDWRVYYSALDTFIGTGFGTIGEAVPPSAADNRMILGGAEDAYKTMPTPSPTSLTRFHCIAFNDALNTDVYSFVAWATTPSSSVISCVVIFDALKQYNASDIDPCVFFTQPLSLGGASNSWNANGSGDAAWRGWYKMNGAGEEFVAWRAQAYNIASNYAPSENGSQGVGPDPVDEAEPQIEILLAREQVSFPSAQSIKGTLARIRFAATGYRVWPSRHDPTSVAEARIVLNGVWVPWIANTVGSTA